MTDNHNTDDAAYKNATGPNGNVYYCPNCRSELEEISSCGSVGYFCNKCNELISRKRILTEK